MSPFPRKRTLGASGHRRESSGDASRSSRSAGEDIVPAHKASLVQLLAEHERELNDFVRAFDATEAGGTSSDHLAGGGRRGGRRNRAATGDLAQDGRSLAASVARCSAIRWGRGASERCAPQWCAGDVFAGNDLPNHGACLRRSRTLDEPISHWSQSELARQAVARGIVKSISHSSVGRL